MRRHLAKGLSLVAASLSMILVGWVAHVGAVTITVKKAIEARETQDIYWKAWLNFSYHIKENHTLHTERKETGRYSNVDNPQDVSGVAIELISENPLSTGRVYKVDRTGCNPPFLKSFPKNHEWIAVIKRGECSYTQKIKNAIKVNASGVLIYDNDEDSNDLQAMPNPAGSTIPSVFTFNFEGTNLVTAIRKHSPVTLRLQPSSKCRRRNSHDSCKEVDEWQDQGSLAKIFFGSQKGSTPWSWKNTTVGLDWKTLQGIHFWNITGMTKPILNVEKRTSVLFVSVSFMILMLISLAWLIFYYIQRFRYIHAKDQRERKLTGQAKRALALISTNVLKSEDLDSKHFNDTCAVCIENCKFYSRSRYVIQLFFVNLKKKLIQKKLTPIFLN